MAPCAPLAKRKTKGRGRPTPELALALAGALIALIVYVPRLCPGLCVLGDSAVFVSAAAELGVAQPSGYPLYTALGKLATLVPIGSLPWRVHLLSALAHAGTAAVLVATIQSLGAGRGAALAGALVIAFSRPILLGSLYAEVFPLLDLFTAAVLYAALRCSQAPSAAELERRLLILCGVFGVATAHHQMISLALPGVIVLLQGCAWKELSLRRIALRGLALLSLPPLLFHLSLLLHAGRDPATNWGDIGSLSELVRLVTRQDYGGLFSPHLGQSQSSAARQLSVYFENLGGALGPMGLAALALGLFALARQAPRVALAYAVSALAAGPIFALANGLGVGDEFGKAYAERFSTMSIMTLGPFIGAGLGLVETWLARALEPRIAAAVVAATLAVPVFRASDWTLSSHQRGAMLAAELVESVPDGALVLITGDAAGGAIDYRCGVERACGSRIVFSPGQLHLDWRVRQLRRRHPALRLPAKPWGSVSALIAANLPERPVYVLADLLDKEPPLRAAYSFLPEGLLLRVRPLSMDRPDPSPSAGNAARLLAECRGCRPSVGFEPVLSRPVRTIYVTALLNHSRLLAATGGRRELATRLVERARKLDPALVRELD